jgi:segregation and condensation protein A
MYKIKLPNFEGPFDLLLYFIKRDELNIYDIPIARITEEFLRYVRIMQSLDLELAAEFITMASTLLFIKTQMLLPQEENEDGTPTEDPRNELVQKLLEYKQFKEAAHEFDLMAAEQKYIYYRKLFDEDMKIAELAVEKEYKNSNIYELIKAFKKMVQNKVDSEFKHVINFEPVSIEEKRSLILKELKIHKRISLFGLIRTFNRIETIVTFLALLELIKVGEISVMQEQVFSDVIIFAKPQLSLN